MKTHSFLILISETTVIPKTSVRAKMMKISKNIRFIAIGITLFGAIAPVVAQQVAPARGPDSQGRQQRGGNSMGMIVRMSTVQKELRLTQKQITVINELRPPQGQGGFGGPPPQGQGGQGGFGDRPPQGQGGQHGFEGPPPQSRDGQHGFEGPPPQGQGGQTMRENPLAKILDENQLHRLQQLSLQFDAPMSFLRPEVGKEMEFGEDQRQSILQIIQETMPRQMDGSRPGQGQNPGTQGPGQRPGQGQTVDWASMQAKKQAAFQRAFALLNGDQKSMWTKLTGKTFKDWEEPKRP